MHLNYLQLKSFLIFKIVCPICCDVDVSKFFIFDSVGITNNNGVTIDINYSDILNEILETKYKQIIDNALNTLSKLVIDVSILNITSTKYITISTDIIIEFPSSF